jgi:O-antigen/teichoic acid export membrane protein
MLTIWGPTGYGMFALASSLLVSLAILDCGVRSLTRLRLSRALAEQDEQAYNVALCEGLAAFGFVALLVFLAALAIAWGGWWSRWLHLPPEGNALIAMTVGLVGLFMLSVLALEPLAAANRISALKAVNTIGALTAIPVVGLFVWFRQSVTAVTFVYFLCLTLPNLYLFITAVCFKTRFWRQWHCVQWGDLIATLHSGGWYYATTLALIAKTHALTFIVSGVGGPAEAGTFYILLRVTEIVGGLGAASSDTSLASLAGEKLPSRRAQNFRHSYMYALIFCIHGALVIGFLAPMLFYRWLPGVAGNLPRGIGWAMAAYGLAGAFSKVAVNAAMGTGLVRRAAIGNLIEAGLVLTSALALKPIFGLTGLFVGASLACVALLPTAGSLAKDFGQTFRETWIRPIGSELPFILVSGIALGLAWWSHLLGCAFAAISLTSVLVIFRIWRLGYRS